jgi:hypothetical protein
MATAQLDIGGLIWVWNESRIPQPHIHLVYIYMYLNIGDVLSLIGIRPAFLHFWHPISRFIPFALLVWLMPSVMRMWTILYPCQLWKRIQWRWSSNWTIVQSQSKIFLFEKLIQQGSCKCRSSMSPSTRCRRFCCLYEWIFHYAWSWSGWLGFQSVLNLYFQVWSARCDGQWNSETFTHWTINLIWMLLDGPSSGKISILCNYPFTLCIVTRCDSKTMYSHAIPG